MVSEPVSKKFGTEISLRTGLEIILVPKKVSESVSKKFGTKNVSESVLKKNLVPKKSLGIGIVHFFGLVTHCNSCTVDRFTKRLFSITDKSRPVLMEELLA